MLITILFKKTKESKKTNRSTIALLGINNKKPIDIEEQQEKIRIEKIQHKKIFLY